MFTATTIMLTASTYMFTLSSFSPLWTSVMQRVFELSSFLVLPFWLLMILAPRWRWTRRIVASPFIVAGPVALYAALLLPHLFTILPALMQPRMEPIAALLGQPLGTPIAWAHFLALDLFAARWI